MLPETRLRTAATPASRRVAARAPGPAELLAGYRPGASALFASPRRTMLATGNQLGSDASFPAQKLDVEVARLFGSYEVPAVLAAVPYDPDGSAWVIVPERLDVAGPLDEHELHGVGGRRAVDGQPSSWQISGRPTRDGYATSVARAVSRIGAGELNKVVLARALDMTGGAVDPAAILTRLAQHDPHAYTYAVDLTPGGGGSPRRLVGASPELLVARHDGRVVARPLAGSAARSADPSEDARRGAALLASTKDLAEHAFVVEAVVEALTPYCTEITVPRQPSLIRTATMWHLLTEVSGELVDPAVTSLTLALALHPTPAVCGTPKVAAYDAISELEDLDRDFYAGFVGWCDAEGDGEWAIALRCAELQDDSIRLYAGAGVVAGSDPAAEVSETGAKFRTMLNAMGIEYDA